MIWPLMAFWALGVALVTVWPLVATLVFATAAVLALATIVRSDVQAESYGSIVVVWLVLSLWVGTIAFMQWRDRRNAVALRPARIAHTER